ncbi:serine hydrolase [Roseococcus suduntuyensis]|uniref:beta-lactamase n=1 Tax=Roseococcus suduntuyensis TaxID=455361 RepID=A0A840AFX3_9PROT|nr:serine hydrolase [Roseococcus suduntuyensis]MBB3899436.1 beta-lactamase class A [Roseococcus suduntuyensis]
MPQLSRRQAWLAAPALIPASAVAQQTDAASRAAMEALVGLAAPLGGRVGVRVTVDAPTGAWHLAHEGARPLFVGSATKSFILAAYLLAVERGEASLEEPLAVEDEVRAPSSSVLEGLRGTMAARFVLEAMIAHSDNTATDMAMKRVGVAAVRDVITRAGLRGVQVAGSTRRMVSYLAGAAPGQDLGWAGVQAAMAGALPQPPRLVMNEHESMIAPPEALAAWYRFVLSGGLFAREESLKEFQRISATATILPMVVPPHTAAYGKGGSIVWNDENALALGAQMRVRDIAASFGFALNWPGGPETVPRTMESVVTRLRALLAAVAARIG